jgi:hypothetical protein
MGGDDMPTPRKYETNAARHRAYRERQKEARRLEQREKGLPASPKIPTIPGADRWEKMLVKARLLLGTVVEERDAYYEERSEDWQESAKGDAFNERTEAINEAMDALEALL